MAAWTSWFVPEEIRKGPPEDPARKAIDFGLDAEIIEAPKDEDVLAWSLGAGETAVLALARARKAIAILDDFEARSAASVFGIPCTGTLGVVRNVSMVLRHDSFAI